MKKANQRKHHYIYRITRVDGSGKYYIGMHSTDDLDDGYFGSGSILSKSIKKHGKDIHVKEILEYLPTRDALKHREKEIVNEEMLRDNLCMNLKIGGEGGGRIWSQEHFDALQSKAHLGGLKSGAKNIEMARQLITSEHRKIGLATRVSNGNPLTTSGMKFSEETRSQMSESASGTKNSQYGTCWVTNGIAKKINKQDLELYLMNGYSKGRTTRL